MNDVRIQDIMCMCLVHCSLVDIIYNYSSLSVINRAGRTALPLSLCIQIPLASIIPGQPQKTKMTKYDSVAAAAPHHHHHPPTSTLHQTESSDDEDSWSDSD